MPMNSKRSSRWLNCGISKMANAIESFVTAQNINLFKTLLSTQTNAEYCFNCLKMNSRSFLKL